MNAIIYEDLDNFLEEFTSQEQFKELLSLKKTIDDKYFKEIMYFKQKEMEYNEALKYESYYDNIEDIKNKLSLAKQKLFEKDEVRRYLKLERLLSQDLVRLSNELAQTFSNKFNLKKIIG